MTRSHRKAFGPQRSMTLTQKARYVAESIRLRQEEGRAWSWAEYGIEAKPEMITLVSNYLQRNAG